MKVEILLVDDDEVDRELIKKSLKALDADIIEATTGLMALEVIKQRAGRDFSMVLLDYKLPDIGGMELIAAVKKLTNTPIVIVTGVGSEDLVVATTVAGVIDYIPKNKITPEFLTRTILNDLLIHKAQMDKERMEREVSAHKDVLTEIIRLAKERLAFYDKEEQQQQS